MPAKQPSYCPGTPGRPCRGNRKGGAARVKSGRTTCGLCAQRTSAGQASSGSVSSAVDAVEAAHDSQQDDGLQPWAEREVTLHEMLQALTAMGCGKAPHNAPMVGIVRDADGLRLNLSQRQGEMMCFAEVNDPTAAGLPELYAEVNGRLLQDALRAHSVAERKTLSFADLSIDPEGNVEVGGVGLGDFAGHPDYQGKNREDIDEMERDWESEAQTGFMVGLMHFDDLAETTFHDDIEAAQFVDECENVALVASTDSSRPVLQGVQFLRAEGRPRMIATDSYRINSSAVAVPPDFADASVRVPAVNLKTWAKLARSHLGADAPTHLGTSVSPLGSCAVQVGQMRLGSKCAYDPKRDVYPNWAGLMHEPDGKSVAFDLADLADVPVVGKRFKQKDEDHLIELTLRRDDSQQDKLGWCYPVSSAVHPTIHPKEQVDGEIALQRALPRYPSTSSPDRPRKSPHFKPPDRGGFKPVELGDSLRFVAAHQGDFDESSSGGAALHQWDPSGSGNIGGPLLVLSADTPDWRQADRFAMLMPVRLS